MSNRNRSQSDPQQPVSPFVTEDKSLESQADEAKDATPQEQPKPKGETVTVKLLHHSSHDGEDLLPGREYALPRAKALSLVAAKRAVRPESN